MPSKSYKWINKKWKVDFYVIAMATAGSRWAVVMSRNASFTDQVCWQLNISMLYNQSIVRRILLT
jgi:hypothetical protein